MSLEYLHPYAGDHAIQSAVFALDFLDPLNESVLKDLRKSANKSLLAEFPTVQDQQSVALNFNTGQDSQQLTSIAKTGGFVMQKASQLPGLPSRVIVVSPNNCMIIVNDYSRWKAVKSDVDRYFAAILTVLNKNTVPINSIGLQYTDVFNWKADPSELVLSEVFAANGPFLVPNILNATAPALWHSHHGYFLDCAEPIPFKQLDNINVSRNDGNTLHVVTSHRAQLASPLWKVGAENRAKIDAIQEHLHRANKEILKALFTENLQQKIKLNA